MSDERATVMVVDDNLANLMVAKLALTHTYDVFTVPSAAKMFDMLERNRPSIILLDIEMPETDGMEALSTLKANPSTADIPVIFLTAKDDPESELRGLALGAIDYISKPIMPPILLKRVDLHLTLESQKHRLEEQAKKLEVSVKAIKDFNENLQHMVEDKTREIIKLQNAILHGVANMVESRDDATGGHVERTQRYLRVLISGLNKMGLYQEEMKGWDIELMIDSSQLHDVGKIAISDSILKKPGRLTKEEFEIMKKHVEFGVSIIERIESEASGTDFLRYAKIFAETHHEKWDGSGYPKGLVGSNIPLPGRLMALADVYDALVSVRPYKEALPHEKAARIIREGRGSHFDPVIVDAFDQVADQFALIASEPMNQ